MERSELPQVTVSEVSLAVSPPEPLLWRSMYSPFDPAQRSWRSNSLTPPAACGPQRGVLAGSTSAEMKTRSLSLTFGLKDPRRLLCFQQQPQHHPSCCESEDQFVEEIMRNLPEGSGMRGIREWLKSLRLHKYTKILLEISYEELMELTDEALERKGVTMGARGKILKNIGYMKQRPALIAELSNFLDDVSKTNDMDKLSRVLVELEAILLMPLKPYPELPSSSRPPPPPPSVEDPWTESASTMLPSPANVPGQIFNALKKVFMIILLSECANHEVVTVFACLLNRCLKREAFSLVQKQKMSSWLQKMKTLWNPPPIQKANDYRRRSSVVRHDSGGGRRLSNGTGGHGGATAPIAAGSKLPCDVKIGFSPMKRHSYQEETKMLPLKNRDGVDEARRLSYYDQTHSTMPRGQPNMLTPAYGSWCHSSLSLGSRRESNMSTDSGYMMSMPSGSRRPSDADWGGCNKPQPPPPLYGPGSLDHHFFGGNGSSRRDSGLSIASSDHSDTMPSRRSSAFSVSGTIPENLVVHPSRHLNLLPPGLLVNPGSISSGCASDGSTDSLLEQDLHRLSLAVTQQALD